MSKKSNAAISRGSWLMIAVLVVTALALVCAGCGSTAASAAGSASTSTSATAAGGGDVTSTTAGVVLSTTDSVSTTQSTTATTSQATTSTAGQANTTTTLATTTTHGSSTTAAGGVALRVTGPSGTKSYTLAQLKAMPSVSGYWGAHKGELPYANDQYKGVLVTKLLADVGGLPSGSSLTVQTTDNFPCTYDPDRLAQVANGTYQVWDKQTGDESTAAVQLVVAYEMNGKPLDKSTGPLRLVPMTSTNKWVTEGKYSPYWVVSITVK